MQESQSQAGFDKLRKGLSLGLTQDLSLRPAFAVSPGKLKAADEIFEKEQNALVDAALQQRPRSEEEMYINDHGYVWDLCRGVSS